MALTGTARPAQIFDVCQTEANDAGETILMHAPIRRPPNANGVQDLETFEPTSIDGSARKKGTGRRPQRFLVVVFADQAAEARSWTAHVQAETLIGRAERENVRILCLYDNQALRELTMVQGLRLANAHGVFLPRPED
jgi:hypothetical protein